MEETQATPLPAEAPAEAPDDIKQAPETPGGESQEPDLEALLAAAEERGYLRGRNEQITKLMEVPPELTTTVGRPNGMESEILILNNLRSSIWDK